MARHWLIKDRLCCWNDDTIRAELSPRRVAPKGDGFEVVTPEDAAALEAKFTQKWRENIRKAGPRPKGVSQYDFEQSVKPNKADYVFVDKQSRHAPKVWKVYVLTETDEPMLDNRKEPIFNDAGDPVMVHRFLRAGTEATFEEAEALAKSLGAS